MRQKLSFLDLPLIARLAIYRILLVQQEALTPLHHRTIRRYLHKNSARISFLWAGLSLAQTCKKISDEATNVLYGENRFNLRPDNIESIPEFLDLIGRNCSKILSLNINFEYNQEKRWRDKWWSQAEVLDSHTEREDILGLVDGNGFLPEYPVARHVFFAELNMIQRTIPNDISEAGQFGWNQRSLPEDDTALENEDLYDGYPSWAPELEHHLSSDVDSPTIIFQALHSITRCLYLRCLEIWFPDPQRFALGYECLRQDRMFLQRLWPLKKLSNLIIHGIDELGIIATIAEPMKILRVIAELNCSRARPFLHIEAGRPNLRANTNWGVLESNRYTLRFELKNERSISRDRFSELPTEVRALIYDHIFRCWYEGFHGNGHVDDGNIQHPIILLQNLSFGCQRTESGGKYLAGAAALLGVSKLLHEEAAATIYRRYTFSTTPPFGGHRRCCSQMNYEPEFHPDLGLLDNFLSHIGLTNRKRIRHLYLGLHSFILFPKYSKQLRLSDSSRKDPVTQDPTCCVQLCTANVWWKLQRLLMLVQEIPVVASVTLRFSDVGINDQGYFWHQDEHDDFRVLGKHMLDANYYLNLLSDLRNVKHVELAGCLGMTDSELFARLTGAATVAVRRYQEKSSMIHERQSLDNTPKDRGLIEAQAKAWGWVDDDDRNRGCFVKRLTAGNMTPTVARRFWAARGMEEDMAAMANYLDELDICGPIARAI